MGWNTQTWKHDQKKNEIIKGTNTFSQQCIYNGALAKEKKVVPVCLKTDRHAEVKKFIVKTFQAWKRPKSETGKGDGESMGQLQWTSQHLYLVPPSPPLDFSQHNH